MNEQISETGIVRQMMNVARQRPKKIITTSTVGDITIEGTTSDYLYYRNPLVAEAMRVMKYVNKFNRGVTRVQEMLKNNGNSPAEFDVNTITAFRVNVHATNEFDLSKGTSQGTSQTDKTIEEKIIEFCKEPRSLAEITEFCGFKDKRKFRERYLNPLLGTRFQMTIPAKPTSRFQKYVLI